MSRNIGKTLYSIARLTVLKGYFTRIDSYFGNHPVVFSCVFSILLTIALHFIYVILVSLYPPRIIGNYIVYIEYAEGYGTTHRDMLIDIYGSLIFLFLSIAYLSAQVSNTFSALELAIERPQNISTKLVFSRCSYILAFGFGFLFTFGFELFLPWVLGSPLKTVSVNIPIFAYFFSVYFLIAFLVGKGVWMVLASFYWIRKATKQRFKMDVEDPWPWTNDKNIGGFKYLSDLSLTIFKIGVVGILLFSPAVILYYYRAYVAYFFAAILIGLSFLILSQQIIHKGIVKNKEKLRDLAKTKLETGEINQADYLNLLQLVASIKDRPINLSAIWGILISSIVLPVLYWYVLLILKEILGIVPP